MPGQELLTQILPCGSRGRSDKLYRRQIIFGHHRLLSEKDENRRDHEKHPGSISLNGCQVRSSRELLHHKTSRPRKQT
ncbi:hypothetical protein PFISCL1PPCAC_8183, partial [Pristionchus fissidentatus]